MRISIAVTAALLVLDRVLKGLARREKLHFSGKLLRLTHLENPGFFMGAGSRYRAVLRWVPLLIWIAAAILLLPHVERRLSPARLGILLVLSGGLSNQYDRMRRGSVTDYVQLPYGQIALKAVLPALLYFTGIFISVHLEAKKVGLKGLPKEELPKLKPLLKKSYLLLPLVLLIYLVSTSQKSIQYAAALSIVACIVVTLFSRETRITPMRLLEALAAGGQGSITVAAACGIAGIIAGTITMTGLANVIINGIVVLAGDSVFVALFLTMICCIVLGMGVPTTANYCIMASTCAPILIQLNFPVVAAHFFVFYFGIVADITPPVALAAYAGSAIAKSDPMKTGVNATKLAIAAFIVPYIFAYSPALLFENITGWWEVAQICISALLGTALVAKKRRQA